MDYELWETATPESLSLGSKAAIGAIELIVSDNAGGFNRYRMPLLEDMDGVDVTAASSYPERTVVGDSDQFNHSFLSALVQHDWSGGGQVEEAEDSTDLDRFSALAQMDTRRPRMLAPLPLTHEIASPSGTKRPLGDLITGTPPSITTETYVAVDSAIYRLDLPTKTLVTASASLADVPVAQGVMFQGTGTRRLWIPLGSNGYATWDGTTVVNRTDCYPISFIVWKDTLYALEGDGSLWANTAGAADGTVSGWDSAEIAKVDGGYICRHLRVFKEASGAPALCVITDRVVLVYDAANTSFYETEMDYVPRGDAALASATWNTDLYVSVGVDVGIYTGGTRSFRGLNRDDGISPTEATSIVAMTKAWQELMMLVDCDPTVVGTLDPSADAMSGEGGLSIQQSAYKAKVLRYGLDGVMSSAWFSPRVGTEPTWITSANGDEGWFVIWGFDGSLWLQELEWNSQSARFDTLDRMGTGEITSPWWYPAGEGKRALVLACQVMLSDEAEGSGAVFDIYWQLDSENADWTHLMRIDGDSPRNLDDVIYEARFGRLGYQLPDNTDAYEGEICNRIRYRIVRSGTYDNVLFQSIALVFMPVMGEEKTFTVRINCTDPELDRGWGLTNEERREIIDSLVAGKLVGMGYNERWRMVKLTGTTGFDQPGQNIMGDRSMTFVEAWRR